MNLPGGAAGHCRMKCWYHWEEYSVRIVDRQSMVHGYVQRLMIESTSVCTRSCAIASRTRDYDTGDNELRRRLMSVSHLWPSITVANNSHQYAMTGSFVASSFALARNGRHTLGVCGSIVRLVLLMNGNAQSQMLEVMIWIREKSQDGGLEKARSASFSITLQPRERRLSHLLPAFENVRMMGWDTVVVVACHIYTP